MNLKQVASCLYIVQMPQSRGCALVHAGWPRLRAGIFGAEHVSWQELQYMLRRSDFSSRLRIMPLHVVLAG